MSGLIKSAVIGGVVYMLWSMAFGFVHKNEVGYSRFQNRDAVFEVLRENISGSGIYVYPMLSDEVEDGPDFLDLQKQGPVVYVEYSDSVDKFGLMVTLSMLFAFLVAFIAAALLQTVPNLTFWGKALFVMFVASTGEVGWHLQNWLLPAYSTALTLIYIVNATVGWFLAGMAMAKWGGKVG